MRPHRPRNAMLCLFGLVLAVFMPGCKMPGERQDFSKLSEDFVYGSLALSPVSSTAAGYHEHQGIRLDEKLDDYSPGGIQDRGNFIRASVNGWR